ncbi:MAG: metallophosphoesterase [Acidobacteriota bacterium]|jgi:predicted MPP superfamily phosphohydrolase|nr:metallophosphoesterase [Acidobacteriota bacterium]
MKWKLIKIISLCLAVIVMLLAIWGVLIEPRLIDFREETATVPNLPKSWENKKIALIADIQIGMWFGNEDTVKEIVKRIIEIRPAAVLIAGDFVYQPTDEDKLQDIEREDVKNFKNEVNQSVDLLKPLAEAKIPTYAVLGNHDYGMSYPDSVKNEKLAQAIRQTLKSANIKVLENQAVPLELNDKNSEKNNQSEDDIANFYVVGIGSGYAQNAKPELALAEVSDNAPRVIFMHEPDTFTDFAPNTAPFAVAGHTHGGQIRIPFTKNWSWMALLSDEKIKTDGWINNYGNSGNHLYVNRGIGFSSFPVRINCRPELTVFRLQRGN